MSKLLGTRERVVPAALVVALWGISPDLRKTVGDSFLCH